MHDVCGFPRQHSRAADENQVEEIMNDELRIKLAKVLTVLAALTSSSVALAQTCPACYNNAASQNPGLLQALKTGILIMMLPTLVMFLVIFTVVYRRRNSFHAPGDEALEPALDARTDVPLPVTMEGPKPRVWL
jgi:hypothetical protein